MEELGHKSVVVDYRKDHYPLCIVWSPIPLLTWMFPFIGHLGIVTSEGMIHDFIGPYTINTNTRRTGFGLVTKYLPVSIDELHIDAPNKLLSWDTAVERASDKYLGIVHDLICNNCHSHVACALNELNYRNFNGWNTFFLILLMFFKGKHVSIGRSIYTYLPFFIIVTFFFLMLIFGFVTLQ